MFLARTIEDILKNIESDTEVIVVLDGELADPPIPQHERVNIINLSESIGQRAATNLACKLSKAKYIMKLDAHCAFDKGFDRKMLEMFKVTGDNVTMLPVMRNLWAFDWKCYRCGWKRYQADGKPDKCPDCNDSRHIRRKMVWVGKDNPQSTSYCFNSTPQFKYFEDWKHRPQYIKNKEEKKLTETMSIQGSCFMLTRKKYWELDICDETLGSWGNQGIEVACKTWLSGGRVLVNHNTWYAHLFRTNSNLKFPWPVSGRDQQRTKENVRKLLWSGKWEKQIHPVSWLVEKFWPVKGWTEEDLKKLKDNTFKFKKADSADKIDNISKKSEVTDLQTQDRKLKPPEAVDEIVKMNDSSNIIQITEGKRQIFLDVVDLSKDKSIDNLPSGVTFSIEPSKGIIYYADDEVGIKILVKELKGQ